jgi:hypothetical protein
MNPKMSFKRVTLAAVAIACALPMAIFAVCNLTDADDAAASKNSRSPSQGKVCVCHKPTTHPQTKCLPPPAAQAHLNHGDTAGPCP